MATAQEFINFAASQIGVPYVFGGSSPNVGFDCSGLIYWAAEQCGIDIPRTSEGQYGTLPGTSDPTPGDLIFFDVPEDNQAQPAHVAIWLGPNEMLEAPHTGAYVSYSTIPNDQYESVMGYGQMPFDVVPPPPPPPPPKYPPLWAHTQSICNAAVGIYTTRQDGTVDAFDGAPFYGSMAGDKMNGAITGVAGTGNGEGYWICGSDGGVFAFGNAAFHGSMGGEHLNAPVVGIALSGGHNGYYLVAQDGGVFAYGDAQFHGSMGGEKLNAPIVGLVISRSGNGYWLYGTDGGIYAFGDAAFYGSMGGHPLNQPIVGMARSNTGNGYWLVGADGGVFAFGDAPFKGPSQRILQAWGLGIPRAIPVIGIARGDVNNCSYVLIGDSGGIAADLYHIPSDGSFTN